MHGDQVRVLYLRLSAWLLMSAHHVYTYITVSLYFPLPHYNIDRSPYHECFNDNRGSYFKQLELPSYLAWKPTEPHPLDKKEVLALVRPEFWGYLDAAYLMTGKVDWDRMEKLVERSVDYYNQMVSERWERLKRQDGDLLEQGQEQ